jgi:hypothetical protein
MTRSPFTHGSFALRGGFGGGASRGISPGALSQRSNVKQR